MYSPPTPEEINERQDLFRQFLEGHPEPVIEGPKKEAIEKVFFFNDQQFSEVCEDLKEEILRRKNNGTIEFIPKYSLKRNTIREQISLLEEEELKSLVEDTYLVLKHKNAKSPEDELPCLNSLVQSLEEIIGKNTSTYKGTVNNQNSPSAIIIAVEKLRKDLEIEAAAEGKIEILLNMIDKQTSDLATQELLDSAHAQLKIIKTQKQAMATEILTLKNEINDMHIERDMETETTAYEDTVDSVVERITSHFYEIEYILSNNGGAGLSKCLDLLNKERETLLTLSSTKEIKDLGNIPKTLSEKDLLPKIAEYYSAVLTLFPN
ncbi:hypothetical protein NEPAR06_1648 [Nematocida parisii]|uniref:GIT Spa2 homology (SHD) domain-containing protein n=1 Tax=Nematocida parisii (strain ERTm3) TaxID=935791 RepID=I3EGI3_NEMP3|nr:uncharacterized protein NEPG_01175 [Nematocida parisii ERTm1]EIJ88330.1 hypothetical protein NEQG_01774 [Nematocida parisii ERTm3]KAI5127670.1 hypothetical protein NEPAR08_0977 [Nematocida parisii]EIJ93603.1 hypothetical protein NEPG_01175 [Nematocida parisii ERTm1]KAI5129516.1 hypothetical protein NEPAR03_1679 [Nematocida parisii]KAI5141238.1 hypothetical protein NEPAR04_0808 [Nematocida parisii]|eukprot:XP_013059003.1 hypothetical protein NEPG_01175 [Nematocida parisii ERTm1]